MAYKKFNNLKGPYSITMLWPLFMTLPHFLVQLFSFTSADMGFRLIIFNGWNRWSPVKFEGQNVIYKFEPPLPTSSLDIFDGRPDDTLNKQVKVKYS